MRTAITFILAFIPPLLLGTNIALSADYRIIAKTGGVDSAGTDANVSITLIGSLGSSGERQLYSVKDDFERHSVAIYSIHTYDTLGDL